MEATLWSWATENPYLFTVIVVSIAIYFKPIIIAIDKSEKHITNVKGGKDND
jgi:hypothetical protein